MQVRPEYKTFGELFSENNVFHTPKYQRDYSWETEQIEQFCNDIQNALEKYREDENAQHFFGGIVCAQEEGVGNRKIENMLVDGQQRLSTIVLFFSVLKEVIEGFECSGDDLEFRDELCSEAEKYLVYKERVHRQQKSILPRITIGNADNDFFQSAVIGVKLDIKRDSHKLIWEAKEHFRVFFQDSLLVHKGITDSLDVVDQLIKLFEKNFLLIHIIATTVDDAYKLFMVLNDRGINLTEGELLKAHTIGNYDESSKHVIRMSQDWDFILANESKNVSDYLRWIITMITGEHIPASQVLERYKSDYLKQCLAEEEMANRVNFIRLATEKLKLITDAEWPFEQSAQTTHFHKSKLDWLVKKLKHTHVMPLLLASSYTKETVFQKVVSETCKFFIRYKVISNMHASIFSTLYPPLAKSALESKDRFSINSVRNKYGEILKDKDEDGANFSAAINALTYKRKGDNRPIKYLLVTLQENWRWAVSTPSKPASKMISLEDHTVVFDFNNTTIEHLYPYCARAGEECESMEEVKNQIGNLVLLDVNRNRSNADKSFAEKKSEFENTGVGIHSELVGSKWEKKEFEILRKRYIYLLNRVFSF